MSRRLESLTFLMLPLLGSIGAWGATSQDVDSPEATNTVTTPNTGATNVYHDSQFHFRGGPLSGSVSSAGTGGSSLSNTALDIEYEYLNSPRHSYYIHTTFAYNMSTASMPYYGIGAGFRYYLNSTGTSYESSTREFTVTSIPRWRYYVGAGAGISQVIVQQFTAALSVDSTLFEVGVHAGTIYQLNRSMGLELQAGYGQGFGFSTVAAGATLIRFMGGVSVYF